MPNFKDNYNFRSKNLHEELVCVLNMYAKHMATPPLDEYDLYKIIQKVLKKHAYCHGGCSMSDAFFDLINGKLTDGKPNKIKMKKKPLGKV